MVRPGPSSTLRGDGDRDPAGPSPVAAPARTPRIFSGIQPSGVPHIGNDLGAIRNYVKLQWEYEAIYLHRRLPARRASTTPIGCAARPARWRPACSRSVSIRSAAHSSSRVTARRSRSSWLLATVTPVSWLERTPTYKEKRQNQPDDINHGLLTYPVLQAADLVIYKASLVPVEARTRPRTWSCRARSSARSTACGDDAFPEPQAVHTEAPIVLGTDGVRKMSKSLSNTIDIFADEDVVP